MLPLPESICNMYPKTQLLTGVNIFTAKFQTDAGFPDSSVGKESACNAGDPGWIPGLGRSAGEGIGYPLQYSWASLGFSW